MTHRRHVAVILLLALAAAPPGPAVALDCGSPPSSWGDTSAYESWCKNCGGKVSGSGPRIQCTPGPNWGGTVSPGGGPSAFGGLYQAGYALGYYLTRWLFGPDSDLDAARERNAMLAEIERRRIEAERQHREEEAQRLAAIRDRLAAHLKLSGLPGLRLKLGEGGDGPAGIKGLPGIYLEGGNDPYGIPGLPGIYTGGSTPAPSPEGSKLSLKTGDDPAWSAPAPSQPPAATPDPATSMTPQQMADLVELISRLPPEDLERLLSAAELAAAGSRTPAAGEGRPPGQLPGDLRRLSDAAQDAAAATSLEDAAAKAREGFDRPLGAPPVPLASADRSDAVPPPPAAGVPAPAGKAAAEVGPAASPSPAAMGEPVTSAIPVVTVDYVGRFLFPASRDASPFPRNPRPPLMNPLREEQALRDELEAWDDWAARRAAAVREPPDDPLYPATTERLVLNAGTVKEYAPELAARYAGDPSFRREVDRRLQDATQAAALPYYQGIAAAHQAALRAYRDGLEELAATGVLDRLTPLEEQFFEHPQRQQVVADLRKRLAAEEAAAVERAQIEGSARLDREFGLLFQAIRAEAAGR